MQLWTVRLGTVLTESTPNSFQLGGLLATVQVRLERIHLGNLHLTSPHLTNLHLTNLHLTNLFQVRDYHSHGRSCYGPVHSKQGTTTAKA
jgi:hypothetical protein